MSVQPIEVKSAQQWEETVDHAVAVSLARSYVPGCPEEERLLRKLDFRIIVRQSSGHTSHLNTMLTQSSLQAMLLASFCARISRSRKHWVGIH